MLKVLFTGIIALGALLTLGAGVYFQQGTHPAVFKLDNKCTAFMVRPRVAITAGHCFVKNGAQAVQGTFLDGTTDTFTPKIMRFTETGSDFALLLSNKAHRSVLTISIRPLQVEDRLTHIGYTKGELLIYQGVFQSLVHNADGIMYVFSTIADPGNSGGPVLNANGDVVAVFTRILAGRPVGYAMPITFLLDELKAVSY